MGDGAKILGPGGRPLSTQPSISVLKSRNPVPAQLVKAICVATNSNVIVLPFESDLIMGKFAMEQIELFHKIVHRTLGIKEDTNIEP